jgi:hypothetical protein
MASARVRGSHPLRKEHANPSEGPPSRKKRGKGGATLFWESLKGWASPLDLGGL